MVWQKTFAMTIAAGLLAAGMAAAQSVNEEARVVATNAAFDAALSRRDITAIEALWAHESWVTAAHPPSRAPVVGWEAVRRSWVGAFENFPELSVTMAQPVVHTAGTVSWVVGVETIKGRMANGNQVEFQAMTTNIYENRHGSWLMTHHQASRIPQ